MAPRESEPQKETVERVMHEFKHAELRSGTSGQKVKNRESPSSVRSALRTWEAPRSDAADEVCVR